MIDDDPDDELLEETPAEVIEILGFDPKELDMPLNKKDFIFKDEEEEEEEEEEEFEYDDDEEEEEEEYEYDDDEEEEEEEEEVSPIEQAAQAKADEFAGVEEEEEPMVEEAASPLMQAVDDQNVMAQGGVPEAATPQEAVGMELKDEVQERKDVAALRAERLQRLEKLMMQVDEELHDV